jgi:ABC-type arginine transport system permease subunit
MRVGRQNAGVGHGIGGGQLEAASPDRVKTGLGRQLCGQGIVGSHCDRRVMESFRGAILSVERGQLESARAVGMSYGVAMWRIVLPQTWGYLIPSLTNQCTGLIKECSVLSV